MFKNNKWINPSLLWLCRCVANVMTVVENKSFVEILKIVFPSLLEDMINEGMDRYAREDQFSSNSSNSSSRSMTPSSEINASDTASDDTEPEDVGA